MSKTKFALHRSGALSSGSTVTYCHHFFARELSELWSMYISGLYIANLRTCANSRSSSTDVPLEKLTVGMVWKHTVYSGREPSVSVGGNRLRPADPSSEVSIVPT